MLRNSLAKLCCILMIAFLSGCSTVSPKPKTYEQTRDEQQVALARVLEDLWERGHIIPQLQQGAPLTSTSTLGQQAIMTQNQNNLALANAELAKLEQRLQQRRATPSTGDKAVIEALAISDDKLVQYKAAPLSLYRGEAKAWHFTSAQGRQLDLRVVWSEAGSLYIEGQDLMDLSPASADTPFAKQVFYYGEQILAQASFNIVMQVRVPTIH